METIKQDNSGTLSLPENLEKLLTDCTLCPRNCHVNRMAGQIGYCLQTGTLRAARAALHYWEEPCISGFAAQVPVFLAALLDACVFAGAVCGRRSRTGNFGGTPERNFSGTAGKGREQHQPRDTDAFCTADCSGAAGGKAGRIADPDCIQYTPLDEKVSTLQLLDGLVDIYLPDLKYESAELSGLLSNAPDYFETAAAAIAEMVRQVGEPVFAAPDGTQLLAAQMNDACEEADEDAEFLMKKGVIVRHLAPAGTGGRFEESAFLSVKNLWGADLYQSDESVHADSVCAGEDAAKAYAEEVGGARALAGEKRSAA